MRFCTLAWHLSLRTSKPPGPPAGFAEALIGVVRRIEIGRVRERNEREKERERKVRMEIIRNTQDLKCLWSIGKTRSVPAMAAFKNDNENDY